MDNVIYINKVGTILALQSDIWWQQI